jgi:hypothetical protein
MISSSAVTYIILVRTLPYLIVSLVALVPLVALAH